MIRKKHTVKEVVKILRRLSKLGNVNPFDTEADQCLYTGEHGDHCIAGQVLVELGLDPPKYHGDYNTSHPRVIPVFTDNFTPAALGRLIQAQVLTDNHHDPRPWNSYPRGHWAEVLR